MARVEEKIARKDYPAEGIKKGEKYYTWTPYRQRTRRSKTYPKPSELSTAKTATILAAIETAEQQIADATCPDDIEAAMEDVKSATEEVLDEYQSALDAWPNGNAMLEEKIEPVQSFMDELEGWSPDTSDFDSAVNGDDDEEEDDDEDEEDLDLDQIEEKRAKERKEEAAKKDAKPSTNDDKLNEAAEEALQTLRDEAIEVLNTASF